MVCQTLRKQVLLRLLSLLHEVSATTNHTYNTMRNKQEKFEALAQSENFDIIEMSPVTGVPCWVVTGSSGGIGRAGGAGSGIVRNGRLECVELIVGEAMVETLWVRIKCKTNNVDVIVRV